MKIYVLTVMFVHVGSLLHQTLVALKRIRLLVVLTAVALATQAAVLGVGALDGLTRTWAAWSAVTGQAVLALLDADRILPDCFTCRARTSCASGCASRSAGSCSSDCCSASMRSAPTPHGLGAVLAIAVVELAVFVRNQYADYAGT